MREERAAKIDEENERLRSKMLLNGSFTDSPHTIRLFRNPFLFAVRFSVC